jgi:hypothetical protein
MATEEVSTSSKRYTNEFKIEALVRKGAVMR